ncbi:class I fructose-bisphosphate aldolase [Phenylobacterium sp.]|uniref:class I fructose-bisphosphate aldolase n=1 Tax=Phenylobacterium sp. TaxID=1871053 RepID=UPI002630C955|nr:class I fructose-bisphosphate aldolase [Phenylobacterium sp.]
MNLAALNEIAEKMVTPGKGILAADESTGTIQKRFDAIGVENTEQNRRDYRELIFRAAEPMRNYISGVILFEETLYQDAADGTPLVKLIAEAGAAPGIKVDKGAKPLPGFPGETITEGLDGLPQRLEKDYARGARFAKWRAVIDIADGLPTWGAIKANAHALARYAAICQAAQIVPIVEPEVMMDGAHDIERCDEVTRLVLMTVFRELFEQRVALEGIVLKPNMVVCGKDCGKPASVDEVAHRTIAALKATVPAAVPGIAYLSGGQSDEEATAHLDAMNKIGGFPWKMTFSFGRALQAAPQKAWSGERQNVPAAQRAFAHRARMNSLASIGQWEGALEAAA